MKKIGIILLFLTMISMVFAMPNYESEKWQEQTMKETKIGMHCDPSTQIEGAIIYSPNDKEDIPIIEDRIVRMREQHRVQVEAMNNVSFYNVDNETRFTAYDEEEFLGIFQVQRKHEYRFSAENSLYNVEKINRWNDFMYSERNWETMEEE